MISGATIQQVKEQISTLLTEISYINDCFIEYDNELKTDKIVITLNDWYNEKDLRHLLESFKSSAYRIVFRKAPKILPFDF